MIRTFTLVLGIVILAGGCGAGGGGGAGGSTLNQLDRLPDADGDGFPEIEPPDGVVFDPDQTLAMKITNTITRSQAEDASGVSIPSAVAGSISLTVDTAVTLIYPGGVEQVLRGSFPLGPEELAFEVACPENVELLVTALADTPVTSPQAVETFGPFLAAQGDGGNAYPCGALLSMETSANPQTGALVASVVVE